MTFVPNKGILISVDSLNILKMWDLKRFDDPIAEVKVPEPADCAVTSLHITPRQTS